MLYSMLQFSILWWVLFAACGYAYSRHTECHHACLTYACHSWIVIKTSLTLDSKTLSI